MIVREKRESGVSYAHKLVRVQEPIMRIPTLAIHLDRFVSEKKNSYVSHFIKPMLVFPLFKYFLWVLFPMITDVGQIIRSDLFFAFFCVHSISSL